MTQEYVNSQDIEPRYVISVAAKVVGVYTHTLRYYEKIGIIEPARSQGNVRLYSNRDIARIQQVRNLMEDLGVNLAGVEVILRMAERLTELQRKVEESEAELKRLGEGK